MIDSDKGKGIYTEEKWVDRENDAWSGWCKIDRVVRDRWSGER